MIVLSFALPEESKDIVRRLSGARRSGDGALPCITGVLAGREVMVVHSGMGMSAAATRLGRILETTKPSAWIASGFGGGLSPELHVGDIMTAQNFSDRLLLDSIASLPARTGSLITTTQVIETTIQKRDLARHTGAIAVDMETAAIHRLCNASGIPMLAVRAISDDAAHNLPVPTAIWFDLKSQRPRPFRLVFHLATHPSRIASFTGFVRGIHHARARLTDFLISALDLLPRP